MITAVGNQSQPSGIANDNNVGISLNINLPKINFKPIKFSSKSTSKSHKTFRLKTFFAKFNHKLKGKFSFAKPQTVTPKKIPISVIVCAKNEEENVKNFLPLLLEQDYYDFEIAG